jgi:hypothetical protein
MTLSQRLDALRLLRDLQRDLVDSVTMRQETMQAGPAINAFQLAARDLITRVEATLKDTP